jgi:hypothetical protein
MRKFFRISSLAALALGATALTAQAQEKATEITAGVAALQYTDYDGGSTFEGATGGSYFAVGFYMNEGLAIEPSIAFNYFSVSVDDFDTLNSHTSALTFGVAVPYYFNKGWGRKGPYLAPRVTYTSNSIKPCSDDADPGCDSITASQFGLGIAIGTKVPLNDAAALRLQASYQYGFENDETTNSSAFGASFGLSVFLK